MRGPVYPVHVAGARPGLHLPVSRWAEMTVGAACGASLGFLLGILGRLAVGWIFFPPLDTRWPPVGDDRCGGEG